MRLASFVAALFLLSPLIASAQETHKPEEWQKLYEDATSQLKAAQDRKAQLSAENTKLADQVKDLQSKLQQANAQIKTLKLQTDCFDDCAFFLTTYNLYWQTFLQNDPLTRLRWEIFLRDNAPLEAPELLWFRDPQWPWSSEG